MGKYLKTAHYLNLDVVLGALAHFYLFSRFQNTPVDSHTHFTAISLSIAVWAIYILDRIIDNLNPLQAQTVRHLFYKKHKKYLVILLVCLFFIGLYSLFYLEKTTIYFGLFLCFCMFLYWISLSFIEPNKEIITAFLYSLGVIGSALSIYCFQNISYLELIVGMSLFISAYQNLNFLTLVEQEIYPDQIKRRNNAFGRNYLFIFLNVLIIIFGLTITSNSTETLGLVALLINAIIQTWICSQEKTDRYRWLGECGFMVPFIVLFF